MDLGYIEYINKTRALPDSARWACVSTGLVSLLWASGSFVELTSENAFKPF